MKQFTQELSEFGLSLTPAQLEQFSRYQALLIQWSKRMNLTAIKDARLIQQRHFLDSLTCATVTGELRGQRLIDVGTGAGFPGLPLKILYPEMTLTLVESTVKKSQFLQAVVDELGLTDVRILTDRAELLGQDSAHRQQYDWAVGRGVANLRILAEYLLPLCRVGGYMLAQKGENAASEAEEAHSAIDQLGGDTPVLHAVHIPDHDATHYLVVIEKVGQTPDRFPRNVGIPAKRPL